MKFIFLQLFSFAMLFSSISGSEESVGIMNFSRSVDSNNNIVTVWRSCTTSSSSIKTNTYNASTMEWGNIYEITTNVTASDPIVAVNANGTDMSAVIVWAEVNNDVTSLYGSMRLGMGSSWSSPVQISNNKCNVQNEVTLRMNGSGKIVLTFNEYTEDGINFLFFATADIANGNIWTVQQAAN